MSDDYYEVSEADPKLADLWSTYGWLPNEGEDKRFDAFCKLKGVSRTDLVRIGTRITPEGELAWLFPGGIKYRDLNTHERRTSKGATMNRLKIVGSSQPTQGVVVAEGETDAAALARACPNYTIAILPGAMNIQPEMIEQLAVFGPDHTFVALDADEAGDKGAAKIPGRRMRPPEPFKDWAEALSAGGVPEPLDPVCVATGPPAVLVVSHVRDFAAVNEVSAEPILGTTEDTVLAAGGMMMIYGKGGGGKTTLELDMAMHLAQGEDWLGIPVPKPVNVLVLENEGPRGMFRVKLRNKLSHWPHFTGNIYVSEEPWAEFTFASDVHRDALVNVILTHEIDVIMAGPVLRLGMSGGGTPDDVRLFEQLIQKVRSSIDRAVAVVLVHHENKATTVSGAWEGVPDTLVHVYSYGPGSTRVEWEKVRWGSSLHSQTWKLHWGDGMSFVPEVTPSDEDVDAEIREKIIEAVANQPGLMGREIEDAVGKRKERTNKIRDQLVKDGILEVKQHGVAKCYFLRSPANEF